MTVWAVALTYDTFCTTPGVEVLALYKTEKLAWNDALQEGYTRKMPVMLIANTTVLGMTDDNRVIVYPIAVQGG